MGNRRTISVVVVLVIVACVFSACAPPVSLEEYQQLQIELEQTRKDLREAKSELTILKGQQTKAKAYLEVYDRLLDLSRVEKGVAPIYGYYDAGELTLSFDLSTRIQVLEDAELNARWEAFLNSEIGEERIECLDRVLTWAWTGNMCSVLCGCACPPEERGIWEPPLFHHELVVHVRIE